MTGGTLRGADEAVTHGIETSPIERERRMLSGGERHR